MGRFRKIAESGATVAGTTVRGVITGLGVLGAALVVAGVHTLWGKGWSLITAGAFILLASWERNRGQGG